MEFNAVALSRFIDREPRPRVGGKFISSITLVQYDTRDAAIAAVHTTLRTLALDPATTSRETARNLYLASL